MIRAPLPTIAFAGVLLAACACAPQQGASPEPSPYDTGPAMMTATPEQIAQGSDIAHRLCAGCHAVEPDARSTHPEAPPLSRLSERYPVTMLEEALAEGILTGHPDMPVFKLSPEEIDALLGYLDSIQVKRGI
ncbi:MAG: cytochrome c [Hyphomonadaceae bacterium]